MCVSRPETSYAHRPALPAGEVHIWSVRLDQNPLTVARLEAALSSDERQRGARFCFERDRRRYVVARGVLRCLLGALLDDEPERIEFQYGSRGKPELAGCHAGALFFNVSHSHELGLLGFARSWPIGLDVEHKRAIPDIEMLARSVLAVPEYEAYVSLPAADRVTALLRAWTRKEAVMKALGEGLHWLPRSIVVPISEAHHAAFHAVTEDGSDVADYWLRDVSITPDYLAAVAVRARYWHLVSHEWTCGSG